MAPQLEPLVMHQPRTPAIDIKTQPITETRHTDKMHNSEDTHVCASLRAQAPTKMGPKQKVKRGRPSKKQKEKEAREKGKGNLRGAKSKVGSRADKKRQEKAEERRMKGKEGVKGKGKEGKKRKEEKRKKEKDGMDKGNGKRGEATGEEKKGEKGKKEKKGEKPTITSYFHCPKSSKKNDNGMQNHINLESNLTSDAQVIEPKTEDTETKQTIPKIQKQPNSEINTQQDPPNSIKTPPETCQSQTKNANQPSKNALEIEQPTQTENKQPRIVPKTNDTKNTPNQAINEEIAIQLEEQPQLKEEKLSLPEAIVEEKANEESDIDESLSKKSISLSKSKEPRKEVAKERVEDLQPSQGKFQEFYWRYYPIEKCSTVQYVTGEVVFGRVDGRLISQKGGFWVWLRWFIRTV